MSPQVAELLEVGGLLLAALVALTCSSLFSGVETGMYVLNKSRLELRAEAGNARARFLRGLIRRPNHMLGVLLAGNNIVNYVLTFVISSLMLRSFQPQASEILTLVIVTPLLFICGESLPKTIFQAHAETLVYRFTWFLRAAVVMTYATGVAPLVRGIGWCIMRLTGAGRQGRFVLAHEAFSTLVAEGQASGVLTHSQSIMADRAMRLAKIRLGQVMIPLAKTARAPASASVQQLIDLMRRVEFSRLPLMDSAGQVIAAVDIFHLVAAQQTGRLPQLPAPLVLEITMNVPDALYRMQRSRSELAVVAQGGRHVGIVTIKDLVEEIVGELREW